MLVLWLVVLTIISIAALAASIAALVRLNHQSAAPPPYPPPYIAQPWAANPNAASAPAYPARQPDPPPQWVRRHGCTGTMVD